jgi:hypothetical protein
MNRLHRRPYRARPRHVPRLEALEGREVPTTCVVNSLGDAGVGTATDHGDLRFCLSQADARPGEDLILFSVTGTINLTKALPDITDDLMRRDARVDGEDAVTTARPWHSFPEAPRSTRATTRMHPTGTSAGRATRGLRTAPSTVGPEHRGAGACAERLGDGSDRAAGFSPRANADTDRAGAPGVTHRPGAALPGGRDRETGHAARPRHPASGGR